VNQSNVVAQANPPAQTAQANITAPASSNPPNAAAAKDDKDDDDDDDEEEAPKYTDAQKSEAAALAKSKSVDPPSDAKFMPLGVFTLAPEDQEEASAILQLAIAQDGALRGTYYDLLSDQAHQVRGAVDKKTQKAAFYLGTGGKVLFETSLPNLTQGTGGVALHYENGESRHWTLARYAKEPTEEDEDEDPAPKTSPVKSGK
jgi:hypothetical protein